MAPAIKQPEEPGGCTSLWSDRHPNRNGTSGLARLKENLVYLVVKHEAEGRVEKLPVKLAAGDWLWVGPGVEHSFRNCDPRRPVTLYHLRFCLQKRGREVRGFADSPIIGHGEVLELAFAEMLREHRGGQVFASERFRALLTGMFILAARQSLPASSRRPALSSGQCAQLEQYARQRGYRVRFQELAATTRLSPNYFRRIFARTYGCAPKAWLLRGKVSLAAAMLLESSLKIGEIAERSGYPDVFQFSRQFKAIMGVSPRGYRAGGHS